MSTLPATGKTANPMHSKMSVSTRLAISRESSGVVPTVVDATIIFLIQHTPKSP